MTKAFKTASVLNVFSFCVYGCIMCRCIDSIDFVYAFSHYSGCLSKKPLPHVFLLECILTAHVSLGTVIASTVHYTINFEVSLVKQRFVNPFLKINTIHLSMIVPTRWTGFECKFYIRYKSTSAPGIQY